MGLLSDLFIADATPVPNDDGGNALDDADKRQFKGFTPFQGGQFLAVLRGQEYVVEMVGEFQLVTPEDAEDWTMSVPQDMVDSFARRTPDQIPDLAVKFSKATNEEWGWSPNDFVPIVTDLCALARRAFENNKTARPLRPSWRSLGRKVMVGSPNNMA